MKWFEKQKPDCVIAGTNSLREWLREIGAQVPSECGFVSLFPAATRHADEDLARLDSRNERIGEVALSLLDQQIKQHETGIPDDPFTVVIEPGWHEGKTLPWKQSVAGCLSASRRSACAQAEVVLAGGAYETGSGRNYDSPLFSFLFSRLQMSW